MKKLSEDRIFEKHGGSAADTRVRIAVRCIFGMGYAGVGL
jgi:hypothetical protein